MISIAKKFDLGKIIATPGAIDCFAKNGELPTTYILRHVSGDWGDIDKYDQQQNDLAIKDGFRIFSAYKLLDDTRIWIITEADRSVTTVLLPEEY